MKVFMDQIQSIFVFNSFLVLKLGSVYSGTSFYHFTYNERGANELFVAVENHKPWQSDYNVKLLFLLF